MTGAGLPGDGAALVCAVEDRRRITGAPGSSHNGIDWLEVTTADQRTLEVHLLHPAPGEPGGVPAGPAWTPDNLRVTGGERITGIAVTGLAVAGDVLRVTVDTAGDFSPYALRLVASGTEDAVPAGVDPALAAVTFSFKAGCPTRFDCVPDDDCPPAALAPTPPLDYLARDHARLRQILVDRLALHLDDVHPERAAEPLTAMVDLLAHVAEQVSVTGDLVATETHLHTARSRISLRRHARLLDHALHDGTNARTWVALEVAAGSAADGALLDEGTALVTRGQGAEAALAAVPPASGGATVFATLHPIRLAAARSELAFHTWSDAECCLPAGATSATFVRPPGLDLAPGDVLVLEEVVGRDTGLAADADRGRRQAVRLVDVHEDRDPVEAVDVVTVTWHAGDALTTPLCLSATIGAGALPLPTALARGNVVLADHGHPLDVVPLVPDVVDPALQRGRPWRPQVALDGLTVACAYDHDAALTAAAAEALAPDRATALPSLRLVELGAAVDAPDWLPARDLLGAEGSAPRFVVEFERGAASDRIGRARLRAGDDRAGRRPPDGTRFRASGRRGGGAEGNVGPEALGHVVTGLAGITRVRNPLPALGGTPPESFAQVRRSAPEAFRTQRRAVTLADYVTIAEEHPDVQRAAAAVRWTGSWHTVFVTVDRLGGRRVRGDVAFRDDLVGRLDARRLTGADVEMRDPVDVAVELGLRICVAPEVVRGDVEREVRRRLSARVFADGSTGEFHPDRWSFGDALYLSPVLAAVQAVDGVVSVEAVAFQRFGRASAGELDAGVLGVADAEVVRLDDDPSFPERGRLTIELAGGR